MFTNNEYEKVKHAIQQLGYSNIYDDKVFSILRMYTGIKTTENTDLDAEVSGLKNEIKKLEEIVFLKKEIKRLKELEKEA